MLLPHLERRLKKCMPQWLEKIHKAKYVADLLKTSTKSKNYLNIEEFDHCMVGEIYNFQSDDYQGCKTCRSFSITFMETIQCAKTYFSKTEKKWNEEYKDELEFMLKPFLKHLREEHPKVYQKCKQEKKI